ncbi:MAG: PEGA domain-containing protein [Planctomycetaceae bacterium]|nr:PEGA domain-containing protein [Planctomycetaceae bacterium]
MRLWLIPLPLQRLLYAIVGMVLMSSASGCIQRRLTVRTNPPGALVYIDNYEIGTTPVATDYVYYGTRNVRIVKDGYETLEVKQYIPAPWYDWFPLDFVTENLVPVELRDERALDFELKPQMVKPTHELMSRAEGLRRGNQTAGFVAPPPALQGDTGIVVPELIPNMKAPTWPLPAP